MTRVWFSAALETTAAFWRIFRRDGIALGFTSHDHDLWFDGLLHRAAPGMVPSSIRKSADFEPDSAEVEGVLSHAAISAADLAAGRFDGAQLRIGLVDWASGDSEVIYAGTLGEIAEEELGFTAQLVSRKAELLRDPIPRTSPSCRAEFCGPGCNLSPVGFTHEALVGDIAFAANAVVLETAAAADDLVGGFIRWLDGPQAGSRMGIVAATVDGLVLDAPLDPALAPGAAAMVREGCDHTLDTCATRFGNAVDFQGEPFLPGNDMITRYPVPAP